MTPSPVPKPICPLRIESTAPRPKPRNNAKQETTTIKHTHTSAIAALPPSPTGVGATRRRGRPSLLAVALVGALATAMAQAQTAPGYSRPLALAPAEPEAGGRRRPRECRGTRQATPEPPRGTHQCADSRHFDFGAGPNGDVFLPGLRRPLGEFLGGPPFPVDHRRGRPDAGPPGRLASVKVWNLTTLPDLLRLRVSPPFRCLANAAQFPTPIR